MKDYYGSLQKAVGRGKKAAKPATSRTMKGRVEDAEEKAEKQSKINKNMANVSKFVSKAGENVAKALGGVGTALLNNKEMTGKVGQALGGVGAILLRKRRKRKLSELQSKGGGSSGTRVR